MSEIEPPEPPPPAPEGFSEAPFGLRVAAEGFECEAKSVKYFGIVGFEVPGDAIAFNGQIEATVPPVDQTEIGMQFTALRVVAQGVIVVLDGLLE